MKRYKRALFFNRRLFAASIFAAAAFFTATAFFTASAVADTLTKNGFDLSQSLIPPQEIFHGGPPRDGIPAIDQPRFVTAAQAGFLQDDDIILGVTVGGVARAYPTKILVWHELVNDSIGDSAFVVTYCPLCGTGMVFSRMINGEARRFGVSGLLYQSDVLMYDRETESLWSQLALKAVSGEAAGATLTWLPAAHMTWAAWRKRHPHSEVLSTDTGFARDYTVNVYEKYFASARAMFPVPFLRHELPQKAWVIGVLLGGEAKAYPVESFSAQTVVNDEVGGRAIRVRYNPQTRHPQITDQDGNTLPAVLVFWFAWQAFYPATGLYAFG